MPRKDTASDSALYITIDNLQVLSKHGYYAEERKVEQEFLVSLVIAVDALQATKADNLKATIDYDSIRALILRVFSKRKRYLIETLAGSVCDALLDDARVVSVDISIRKTAVWKDGVPGVRLIKKRRIS